MKYYLIFLFSLFSFLSTGVACDRDALESGIKALTYKAVTEKVGKVKKVVNSKMAHAELRAVKRAGFSNASEAREALQKFAKNIQENGLPPGTVFDTARADRIIVPNFGKGGAVVYRFKDGKLTLQTVLEMRGS